MAKVLIIFGSETGNTKAAAGMIAEALRAKGHAVEIRDVTDTTVAALKEPFDLFLLGVSTWGAVDEEVTQDYESFHEDMQHIDLTGKKVAVFGCGDKGYEHFCKAVDFAADRALGRGAQLVAERLKIDLNPSGSVEAINAWSAKLAEVLV